MAFSVDGSGVNSMARLTIYGKEKMIGVLSAVGTRESRMRRGLAKATISSLLEGFKGKVRLVVDPDNEPAKALYTSLGFKKKGKEIMEYVPTP